MNATNPFYTFVEKAKGTSILEYGKHPKDNLKKAQSRLEGKHGIWLSQDISNVLH